MPLARAGRRRSFSWSATIGLLALVAAGACRKDGAGRSEGGGRAWPATKNVVPQPVARPSAEKLEAAVSGLKTASVPRALRPGPKPPAPPEHLLVPSRLMLRAPKEFTVVMETSRGPFEIRVLRDWAPYSADRFFTLAKARYFEGLRFFDVVKATSVGFGIHGHPAVNKAWLEARMLDDIPKWSNQRGLISFASFGPGTRALDLQIHLRDNSALDKQGFVPFGVVTKGLKVVDALYGGYAASNELNPISPRRSQLVKEGDGFLTANFPKLDFIKTVTLKAGAGSRKARR
ncbi:MAG TPA: peptidylprolyl isomerase [Polyangia bacterium]